jgi:hypothetical protein
MINSEHQQIVPAHDSDSCIHTGFETEVLRRIEAEQGLHFTQEPLDVSSAEVDGIDRQNRALCEVYCHVGKLKKGHKGKLATDVLKLTYLEKALGGEWRKILGLTGEEAKDYCTGNSWLADAARVFGIEVIFVELGEEKRRELEVAQLRNAVGIAPPASGGGPAALADWIESLSDIDEGLEDGAAQHDHYLYGSPKR